MYMIKVVSFDIGGTLITYSRESSLKQVLLEVTPVCNEKFQQAYTKHFINKEGSFLSFCQELQIENPQRLSQIIDHYYMNKPLASVYNDVYLTLNKIKQSGRTLITLSNKSYRNPACLESYGLQHLFTKEIYSYDVGYRKPDIRIFRYVEESLHVKPEEILHVGDSIKSDYQGAQMASWHSILLCREENLIVYETTLGMQVIHNLESLFELIDKIE